MKKSKLFISECMADQVRKRYHLALAPARPTRRGQSRVHFYGRDNVPRSTADGSCCFSPFSTTAGHVPPPLPAARPGPRLCHPQADLQHRHEDEVARDLQARQAASEARLALNCCCKMDGDAPLTAARPAKLPAGRRAQERGSSCAEQQRGRWCHCFFTNFLLFNSACKGCPGQFVCCMPRRVVARAPRATAS